jgi:MFS transporter, putative metabolite:H+ symporter
LGKILGPLCLALIAGSDNLVSARATEEAIVPAFLFLAACGAALGLCFIGAPETKGMALVLDDDVINESPGLARPPACDSGNRKA